MYSGYDIRLHFNTRQYLYCVYHMLTPSAMSEYLVLVLVGRGHVCIRTTHYLIASRFPPGRVGSLSMGFNGG
jgi:hypothetical protein